MSSTGMSLSFEDSILTPVSKAFEHITLMLEHNKKVYQERRSRLQELIKRKSEIEASGSSSPPSANQQEQQQQQQQQIEQPPGSLSRTGSTGFYSTIPTPTSNMNSQSSNAPPSQPSSLSVNQRMPPPTATSTLRPGAEPAVTSAISSIRGVQNTNSLTITDETSGKNPYRAPSGLSTMKTQQTTRDTGGEGGDPGATYSVTNPTGFTSSPTQNGTESMYISHSPVAVSSSTQQGASSSRGGFTQSSDPTPLSGSYQPSDPTPQSGSYQPSGSTPMSGSYQPSGSTHQGGFTQTSGSTKQGCVGSSCASGTTTGFQVLHCPDCNAKLGIVFEIFHMDGCPGNDNSGTAHAHNN